MPTYYASATNVWNAWANTTSTAAETVWASWSNSTSTTNITYQPTYTYRAPQVATPEQMAAEAARRAEQARLAEERRAEVAEAKRRARVILEENLTPEQRRQFAADDWFEVVTPRGNYRIRRGWSGNVERHVGGRATDRYCIHPREDVPEEDNMLIQKLMLEADEDAFLRIANRSAPAA